MSKFYDFEAEDVMCNMHKMEEYQEQGFEILDFLCNQFGNQAPGTNEEIVSFCDAKFGITFKHYAKIDVNGADIKWNFTKFLSLYPFRLPCVPACRGFCPAAAILREHK